MEEKEEKKRLSKKEKKELKYQRLKEKYKEKKTKRTKRKKAPENQVRSNYRIWIEVLGGSDLMTDKEMRSLCEQIRYVYAANRVAQNPVNLTVGNSTLLNGYLRQDIENWTNIQFRSKSIMDMAECGEVREEEGVKVTESTEESLKPESAEESLKPEGAKEGLKPESAEYKPEGSKMTESAKVTESAENKPENNPESDKPESTKNHDNLETKDPLDDSIDGSVDISDIVVLTADAEEELTEMEEGTIYVIGGLVDRNRHKGYTERRFKESFRTARLPIEKKLNSSTVLSTLHVFNILLSYTQTQDWNAAIEEHLPMRKQVKPEPAAETNSDKVEETKHSKE
ncbi:tRNA (guanine9-N1)-methyltransferase [Nematocida ausubeli]|nr:tRNA (guanine9-N1)-methyltransferase [Nematocida ausubeli]